MNAKIFCLCSLAFVFQLSAQTNNQTTLQPVQVNQGMFTGRWVTNGGKPHVEVTLNPNFSAADKDRLIKSVFENLNGMPYTPPKPSLSMRLIPINAGKSALPFTVTTTETPATHEFENISNQTAAFLLAREYDQLDVLAAKYRTSRESDANGHWKLNNVYIGLEVSDNASDAEYESNLNILRDWIKTKPDSITARVALADTLIAYAWKARGTGYADTVTDKGLEVCLDRLHQAADVLLQAKHVKEQCPRYWSALMKVGLGLQAGKSQLNSIFNQATQAEPDYESYYVTRSNFLLPRWYGNPGEWERDLEQSADRIGGENGDVLYCRVVWDMHQYFSNIFDENKLSWPRVSRGFEAIEKRFPDSLAAKSEHAFLAVLADDKTTAQRCFGDTRGKADLSVWDSKEQFLSFVTYAYLVK